MLLTDEIDFMTRLVHRLRIRDLRV